MNAALVVIFIAMGLALLAGLAARYGRDMDLAQWTVAARGLGGFFVFLLLAGEHFSAFVFLGASGFAYGKGGSAIYGLVYATLGWCMGYWMLPPIWRYARTHNLLSQPDFFTHKYNSPALGVLVSLSPIFTPPFMF